MEYLLLLQYILSLTAVVLAVLGLSRLKKALLYLSHRLQKRPPSNP